MHGGVLLVSYVEAGVMVHGSEITLAEQNLTLTNYGIPMVEMGQYYDTS